MISFSACGSLGSCSGEIGTRGLNHVPIPPLLPKQRPIHFAAVSQPAPAGQCEPAAASRSPPAASPAAPASRLPHLARPAARRSGHAPAVWRTGTSLVRPTTRPSADRHTPRHSAYRSQFVVVAYPWHPLHGQRVRVYGRQGRAGRQILYIEVRPGLSREIPAWMCDGAACATITSGSAQIALAGLIELRAVLDGHSAGEPAAPSSTSSTAKEGLDETSVPQPTGARSRTRRQTEPAATGAGGAAQRAGRPAARSPEQSNQRDAGRAGGM